MKLKKSETQMARQRCRRSMFLESGFVYQFFVYQFWFFSGETQKM